MCTRWNPVGRSFFELDLDSNIAIVSFQLYKYKMKSLLNGLFVGPVGWSFFEMDLNLDSNIVFS